MWKKKLNMSFSIILLGLSFERMFHHPSLPLAPPLSPLSLSTSPPLLLSLTLLSSSPSLSLPPLSLALLSSFPSPSHSCPSLLLLTLALLCSFSLLPFSPPIPFPFPSPSPSCPSLLLSPLPLTLGLLSSFPFPLSLSLLPFSAPPSSLYYPPSLCPSFLLSPTYLHNCTLPIPAHTMTTVHSPCHSLQW